MFLKSSQYSQENSKAFLTFAGGWGGGGGGIKMENYQKENQKNIFRQCEKTSEYFILSEDTVLKGKLNYLCSTVYYLLRFSFAFDEREAY